ncbi:inactive protein RESTRICTED TEV MOVEMENT 2-like [Gossypium arboreum]|uniref:SHSP domain-containing protein n=1 Tax=Gossypium arboreum TaxID=29729 RepID=A0ABR0N5E8_GOSAR|nr:inactive protein RESTRICTED TEV MOVEMENT 2-like [Gossypium arboreum]KAK5785795.1 hypothetical protein PVK06_040413 [Gossypium arboreum]
MKNEGRSEPLYDDFEPYCEWKKQSGASILDEVDILEIQLQGFKKEDVKCEMRKDGILYISGEHPMGKNQIKRFNKKIDVSKYEIKGIEAQFEGGKLQLRLPCKYPPITFLAIGKDPNYKALILRLSHKFVKGTTSSAMALVLLLLLGVFMYKYLECISIQN